MQQDLQNKNGLVQSVFNEVYDQYQKLSIGFYKKNKTGDLMNRITEDITKVRMYLGPAVMYSINLTILFSLVIYKMCQWMS